MTEPFGAELTPFPPASGHLPGMPSPKDIADLLLARFAEAVQREREQRGPVTNQTDVAHLVRACQGWAEVVLQYAAALKQVATQAKKVQEEELFTVCGEQDGIPQGRLDVPDGGTTIKVRAKVENKHDIDGTQVIAALAASEAARWRLNPNMADPEDQPEEYALAVAQRVLELYGSQKLQVSKVQALAAELQRYSEDVLAGVVLDAVSTTRVYKGVDVDRKAG